MRRRPCAARSGGPSVLYTIGSLEIGGAEQQLILLARTLAARGWTVRVFALDTTGPLRDDLGGTGVEIVAGGYDMQRPRWIKGLQLCRAQLRLVRLVRQQRPDVLHGYLPLTNWMGAVAGRLGGAGRVVTSRRGLGTHQDRHPWWRPLDRLTNALSDVVTANSKPVAADVERRDGLAAERIVLVRNAIDTARFHPRPALREEVRLELGLRPEHVALVYVANYTRAKGHEDLLEAFAPVARIRAGLRLVLVGQEREAAAAVAGRIQALGLTERVLRLGGRRDVPRLLAGMDLGVHPSRQEGSSNAVLEMVACGLPVVVTDVGDSAEAVAELPGCRVVPPGRPELLRAALEHAVSELPRLGATADVRARGIAARYGLDVMVERYLDTYRQRP